MGRKRVRKEVLIPGSLLPIPQPGRFHGVITAVNLCESTNVQTATVSLSDERKKLQIPWEEVQEYFLEQPESATKKQKTRGNDLGSLQRARPVAPGKILSAQQREEIAHKCKTTTCNPAPSVKDPKRFGDHLEQRIDALSSVASQKWAVGAKLWLKLRGYCPWPAVMWSMQLCCKKDIEQLISSYKPGTVLVRFYGEHSTMWVRENELEDFDIEDNPRFQMLKTWGRQHHKSHLVEEVLEEVENAIDDEDCEIDRLQELEREKLQDTSAECAACQEEGATVFCQECERSFHTLCVQPPALRVTDLPEDEWTCSFCGECNQVDAAAAADEERNAAIERMGLTPDWIIQAAAFSVFELEKPTPERPYIKGLLDPCTNSMAAPNIPAEVLYDKQMNGLKLSNSWAGHAILLNPPYTAATQWRFVNRAIDEVENDRVSGVLLLCRNSTDTAYFQRLTPYPRIMIRRVNTLFKDYSKTPIGFGICMVAIAKSSSRGFYARFFDAFSAMGEPNIPIDKPMIMSDHFHELLDRLRLHAEEHHRDHWVQCSACSKWRILTYTALLAVKDVEWSCRLLKPPHTSCKTPQTKKETMGARYAIIGADKHDTARNTINSTPPLAASEREELLDMSLLAEDPVPEEDLQVPPFIDSTNEEEMELGLQQLSRYLRLPARASGRIASRGTEVMTPIELARQSRIAANRAFLAGLNLASNSISSGKQAPLGNSHALVVTAAKELAHRATFLNAKQQVEKARLQFAKVSQACKKEAVVLNEALQANADELVAAENFLKNAESAYGLLKSSSQEGADVALADKEADKRMATALAESMQAMRPEPHVLLGYKASEEMRRMSTESSTLAEPMTGVLLDHSQ